MNTPDDLSAHMRSVLAAERDLRDLGVVWQMIESSAAISCPDEAASILPTLIQTRERFQRLQSRLIERMAGEYRAELEDDLTAKAQCAIDILVRNLYERTADVGFLATDDGVRSFCAEVGANTNSTGSDETRIAMRQRLCDYQAKYSVYDDILLLGSDGRVLLRLDEAGTLTHSGDPIVAAALQANGCVERHAPSDLAADGQPALLYGHRIVDERSGQAMAVLVLRFRFQDEMQRIFSDVADERHQMALLLLDDQHRVIASDDTAHVPIGARMRAVPAGQVALTTFAGREYLAVRCRTHGYQGYQGPGWEALAMVSLLTAFRQHAGRDEEDPSTVPLDNEELRAIGHEADAINRDLRRVVWNGRLGSGGAGAEALRQGDANRLKAVLAQVNSAGQRTRARVSRATRELYRTALARTRHQATDLARLGADVMDRNLYERANDCRWWALSPALQRSLSEGAAADGDPSRQANDINRVLDHIHRLYTVYSRLAVFDAAGLLRGCSGSADAALQIGQPIDARWLEAVRGLTDPQRYAVSPFEDCSLHDQGPTYVYLAAIRTPGSQALLGGIAIVFAAAREFGTMLREVLADRVGMAAFVDAGGQLLATSHPELAGGALLNFAGEQALVEHEGTHYACARVRCSGYREFKRSDGYDNGASAIVALRLGNAERRRTALGEEVMLAPTLPQRRWSMEVAVFQVGAARYALPAEAVLTALTPKNLVRTPSTRPLAVGLLEVTESERTRLVQVICARRRFGVPYPPRSTDGVVLVLRSPQCPELPAVGLRVDDVLAVISVDRRRLHPAPQGLTQFASWMSGLLDCEVQRLGDEQIRTVLLQLLDPRQICAEILGAVDAPDPWAREDGGPPASLGHPLNRAAAAAATLAA
ncbi:MAG: chemotaxis protein CheW [Burkholderiales bacterium]|jgi:chemotaxis signal transduction protein|nr:chemotaxis protein CheW [Burkholderiales bacterium]MBP7518836.1 chemotaxis protein CheW [Leptothrix sp. (in: b-proteobacteria)]